MEDPDIPCSALHDGHIQDFLDSYFLKKNVLLGLITITRNS